eukprot:12482427-Alexandrium_andersonii.AAC.1
MHLPHPVGFRNRVQEAVLLLGGDVDEIVPDGPSRSPSPVGQPSPTLSEQRARTDAIRWRT